MAVDSAQVSVGTTATALNAAETGGVAGARLVVKLPSGATASVFLGGSTVATTDGFELTAGSQVTVELAGGELLYGIVASGTQSTHVLRSGV